MDRSCQKARKCTDYLNFYLVDGKKESGLEVSLKEEQQSLLLARRGGVGSFLWLHGISLGSGVTGTLGIFCFVLPTTFAKVLL